jgi:hypothetical protein
MLCAGPSLHLKHTLDQWYEDNDLHYLIDSIHNGEWNCYNFGFMKTLNNTVLADMPNYSYVTHSANVPSSLVVTSLLPGRVFSHLLLSHKLTQTDTNMYFFILIWITKLQSQESATSYLKWKSTLHKKLSAVSYCYIRISHNEDN